MASNLEEIEKKTYSLRLLQTPRSAKILTYWIVGILFLLFFAMFLPWQQNSRGNGMVTALAPQDRPQEVTTVIAGQIKEWKIQEGQFVAKGDTILVLSEVKTDYFDPEQLNRLEEQVMAKADNIEATNRNINAIDNRLLALKEGQTFSLEKVKAKIAQNRNKLSVDSIEVLNAKNQLNLEKTQFENSKKQQEAGLISLNEFLKRQGTYQDKFAKYNAAENKYLASQQELYQSLADYSSTKADYMDKIAKAESEKSYYQAYLASAKGELSEKQNKYSNIQIRNNQYVVLAPQSGYIIKALRAGIGEIVKEGEAVITIQPAKPQKAIEVYVKAMDVPLISRGTKVRLEFDGFPALQFSGWPSVNIGTFGGEVAVIDNISLKDNKYRILVIPDKNDEPWPSQVRIGTQVYAWFMLRDVPIWYEIWRQLNGFPPNIEKEPTSNQNTNGKKKK
ncbi:MAG: HlyD family efflux transporter periplasmic adaptor subunit [Thermonemataceae bacterium]|nr:HlyD family efflux transporter periplasmic adaptor subunit [Thermonemataceae bacterium]